MSTINSKEVKLIKLSDETCDSIYSDYTLSEYAITGDEMMLFSNDQCDFNCLIEPTIVQDGKYLGLRKDKYTIEVDFLYSEKLFNLIRKLSMFKYDMSIVFYSNNEIVQTIPLTCTDVVAYNIVSSYNIVHLNMKFVSYVDAIDV